MSKVSHQLFVATRRLRKGFKFDANAVQDYMECRGVRIPSSGKPESGDVLPNLVAIFSVVAGRMQVELQPSKLVVAGSNPAGPIQGDRSSVW